MNVLKIYNKKDISISGYNRLIELNTNYFSEVDASKNIYKYQITADEFMHSRGFLLAAAVKVYLKNGMICTLVVHDSLFEKLPNNVQYFLMYHEIGHCINGDLDSLTELDSKIFLIKRALGILPKIEINADKYAASIIGANKMKEAIMFMIKKTNIPLTSKFELFKRYIRL